MTLHYKSIGFSAILCILSSTIALSNHEYDFQKNLVSLGFYDKSVLPNNIPRPPHPLFWKSQLKADEGLNLTYERNVFHTQKYFSVNLGTSFSWWNTHSQAQLALSGFFDLYIWIFRTTTFSPYISWSVGGPTLLSRRWLNGVNLGSHLIFQDFLGIGVKLGKQHVVDVNLKMYHYSNGDLFVHNNGFDVPVVLSIDYLFH
ncbi:MAG: hypothetical protein A3F41_00595 [Coxiella sp. RIFCSPHIGHO2_12_FULL_44_14]|nr:MAG: hypothetical protein A3F41_00595 [Coxiella sp. RIFCSPHIGHO2_12_FULL_44_14]